MQLNPGRRAPKKKILKSCHTLSQNFEQVILQFVERQANVETHNVSKNVSRRDFVSITS